MSNPNKNQPEQPTAYEAARARAFRLREKPGDTLPEQPTEEPGAAALEVDVTGPKATCWLELRFFEVDDPADSG